MRVQSHPLEGAKNAMWEITSRDEAEKAGYHLSRWRQPGSSLWYASYEKQLIGAPGSSAVMLRVQVAGSSEADAVAKALEALNAQRRHRYERVRPGLMTDVE
jgi:hypothetical protein